MAVHFKFKSAKDFASIPIDGQFISVGNLKERIFESKRLGKGTDFDLMVSNAQTDEEYIDEGAMIPKNTSVLIRRVPGRPRKPIVTETDEPKSMEEQIVDIARPSGIIDASANKFPDEAEWDEFGNDLYAVPEAVPPQFVNNLMVDMARGNTVDEDSKIKALIETTSLDWTRQIQDGYGSGRGFRRGMGGKMMAGRGFGRGEFERKTPPMGYVCHRCKVPGHFIQHCPTNGDPNYDIKKTRPPTGIPKSMLMATPDGSYALPSGVVAVLKPNEAAFEKEIEGIPTTRTLTDFPPELRCPLCKEVMKDAVLTSKCCFSSFCDQCIRDYIISKSACVCGATDVLADNLLPNKTVRDTISRLLDSNTSSAENAGSIVHVQDMESVVPRKNVELVNHVQPKHPSIAVCAVSKDEVKSFPRDDASEVMQDGGACDTRDANSAIAKKTVKKTESEVTPELMTGKELTLQESVPLHDEKMLAGDQGKKKKKKKTHSHGSASEMQWRGFHDFGVDNFSGMPGYNPYWAGGMPLGMEAFVPQPFGGAMPFMGFQPGTFEVPFGGMLPQDPFASHGYMMPSVPPRDPSEVGMSSMSISQGPPIMTREKFDSRRPDLKRKHDIERLNEREHSKDKVADRESGRNADAPSARAKPRVMNKSTSSGDGDRRERGGRDARHEYASPAAREQSRRSPGRERSRPARRRSSERVGEAPPPPPAAAEAAEGKGDRKAKVSVFSRIKFPAGEGGGGRKRKAAEASKDQGDAPETAAANGYREEAKQGRPPPPATAAANGYREEAKPGRRGYEHESSDDERHFKRRPPARREAEEERGRDKPATSSKRR